jgi:hypothetical protein
MYATFAKIADLDVELDTFFYLIDAAGPNSNGELRNQRTRHIFFEQGSIRAGLKMIVSRPGCAARYTAAVFDRLTPARA